MSDLQFPTDRPAYPEESKSGTALALGIIGILFFQLLAPFAWVSGRNELRAIEEGRRNPEGAKNAKIAMILGIVGTVFMVIGTVLLILLFSGVIST